MLRIYYRPSISQLSKNFLLPTSLLTELRMYHFFVYHIRMYIQWVPPNVIPLVIEESMILSGLFRVVGSTAKCYICVERLLRNMTICGKK